MIIKTIERKKMIRAPAKILYGLRFKGMKTKKKPFHPYEESILRTLDKSRMGVTPTKIAKIIGIHPTTAKKKMLLLTKKRLLLLRKRGNRSYFRLNREELELKLDQIRIKNKDINLLL